MERMEEYDSRFDRAKIHRSRIIGKLRRRDKEETNQKLCKDRVLAEGGHLRCPKQKFHDANKNRRILFDLV